jgi:hypothetical protein
VVGFEHGSRWKSRVENLEFELKGGLEMVNSRVGYRTGRRVEVDQILLCKVETET